MKSRSLWAGALTAFASSRQSSSGLSFSVTIYLYGEVRQSNGSVDKSKNNGQIGHVDGAINGSVTEEWDQRFSYDELGRLATARVSAGYGPHAWSARS